MRYRIRGLRNMDKYQIIFEDVDVNLMKELALKAGISVADINSNEAYITSDEFPKIEKFLRTYDGDNKQVIIDNYKEISTEVLRNRVMDLYDKYIQSFDNTVKEKLTKASMEYLKRVNYEGIGIGEIQLVSRGNNLGYVVDYAKSGNEEYLKRYKLRCRK